MIKKLTLWLVLLAALVVPLGAGAVWAVRAVGGPHKHHAAAPGEPAADDEDDSAGNTQVATVKTIKPKRDPSFVIAVDEPAYVEPYFKADLMARVAGPVKSVCKDIGDPVRAGEVLLEIDAPDLEQDVEQKAAVVEQRRQDIQLAKSKVKMAQAGEKVALSAIDMKQAEVLQAQATRDMRQIRYSRFSDLAKLEKGVPKSVVEEEERDYKSAEAGVLSANAAVKKANADSEEMKASTEGAAADVKLKEALLRVAQKDLARAEVLAGFAQVTAPFDGVVLERRVDPGSFVQNASTGHPDPTITVGRIDVVTVTMKVPDNFAAYVTRDTEAVIHMHELPGVVLRGRVTRSSPAIQERDRTMRVEVDLYNGTPKAYDAFLAKLASGFATPAGAGRPLEAATLLAAAQQAWRRDAKGLNDPLPLPPQVKGDPPRGRDHLLLPGMTGTMQLLLRSFDKAYLVPSGAVFSRGGKTYVLVVKDGKARLTPVRVPVDDGRMAKIALITEHTDAKGRREELLEDLTGDEEIIASRQAEVSDGQAVEASLSEW
jgi:multidrug resistance efflux pump